MREKKSKNTISEQIAKNVLSDLKQPTKNIAKAFKTRRTELKLSMASLSKLAGVSTSTINDIEKYKYMVHFDVILKIAYSLGFTYNNVIDLLTINPSKRKKVDYKENGKNLVNLGLMACNLTDIEIAEFMNILDFKLKHKIKDSDLYL